MCHTKALQSCPTLCDLVDYSLPGSSLYGNSSGKNTGVCCHALLQGIFLTQGLNPHLFHLLHLQGRFFTMNTTWEAPQMSITHYKSQSPCYTLDPQTLFIILQLKVCAPWPNSFLNRWFLSTYFYMTCDMFLYLWFWSQEKRCPPPVVSSLALDLWGTIFI